MKRRILATALLATLVASHATCPTQALGQGGVVGGGEIEGGACKAGESFANNYRPSSFCAGTMSYTGTILDWTQYTILSNTTTPAFGTWYTNPAANCGYYPCSSRNAVTNMQVTHTQTNQHCWTVTGSVSVAGKTGLLTALFGELGVTVTIGGQLNGCVTFAEAFQWQLPGNHCFNNRGRDHTTVHTVTGKVDHADARYEWTCMWNPQEGVWASYNTATYCNPTTSTGSATTYGRTYQFAPRPTNCGGFVETPDPCLGVRSAPCCSPLIECGDQVPNGGNQCCDCYSPA